MGIKMMQEAMVILEFFVILMSDFPLSKFIVEEVKITDFSEHTLLKMINFRFLGIIIAEFLPKVSN